MIKLDMLVKKGKNTNYRKIITFFRNIFFIKTKKEGGEGNQFVLEFYLWMGVFGEEGRRSAYEERDNIDWHSLLG